MCVASSTSHVGDGVGICGITQSATENGHSGWRRAAVVRREGVSVSDSPWKERRTVRIVRRFCTTRPSSHMIASATPSVRHCDGNTN